MSVGFIGIGFMGKGMARNALKRYIKDNKIVIYDKNNQQINEFLSDAPANKKDNIKICSSPSEVAQLVDIIALSLPSEEITSNILFGGESISNGFQISKQKHGLVIDHGTFSTQFVKDCYSKSLSNGFSYIDAPVSGGPDGASRGTLSIMIGGSNDDINKAKPILESYSNNIFHFGPVGSGMAAKLVNQALVSMHAAAASEAIYLSKRFGLNDTKLVAEMLRESWGQSRVLDLAFDDYINSQMIGSEILKQTKAPLRNLKKDLHCIISDLSSLKQTNNNKFSLPLLNSTTDLIDKACDNGLKDSAFVSLMNMIEYDKKSN